jgi:hypothetical protein
MDASNGLRVECDVRKLAGARQWVRTRCQQLGVDASNAQLVTSELVSNACGTPTRLPRSRSARSRRSAGEPRLPPQDPVARTAAADGDETRVVERSLWEPPVAIFVTPTTSSTNMLKMKVRRDRQDQEAQHDEQGDGDRHDVTHKEPGWRWGLFVNATGAGLSAIVCVIIAITKFTHGRG